MPTTTNEWLGLALAAAFLLLLAAGLAVLGWRGLRALMRVVREQRFDNADEAWKARSTGSAFSPEAKPPRVPRQSVFLWLIRALAFLFVAPVAMIVRALRNTDGKDGEEFGIPGSRALGFGAFNYRKGKADNGLDPYGIYDPDLDT